MDDLVLLEKIKDKVKTCQKGLPDDLKQSLNAFLNHTNDSVRLKSRNAKTRKRPKTNCSKTFTRKCFPGFNHHTRKVKNKKKDKRTYTRKIKY